MYKLFFKRLADIILSLFLFPLFLFLFLVIGLAIKLEDGGPVFYCGERLGKDMKKFRMFKFRSMKVNAPDIRNDDGSTYNGCDDSRQTRVGRLIRKASADEIPQILNIIKGDMSIIGPRPSPCGNIHLYSSDYKRKFSVRPGITGYAQAYYRNSASIKQIQESDLFYVDNLSFMLDIKVFFKTVETVFTRKGIYRNTGTRVDGKHNPPL